MDFELHRQVTGIVVPYLQIVQMGQELESVSTEEWREALGRTVLDDVWLNLHPQTSKQPSLERILWIFCGLGGQTKTIEWGFRLDRSWLIMAGPMLRVWTS